MSLATLRSKDHYKAIVRELKDAGLSWREEFRGKHAALVISVNGREENEILSITPSDRRALKNSVGHIRRRIKQWKAEAASFEGSAAPAEFPTLEKETMDDNTAFEGQSTDVIEVLGRQITKVEYKGQRVVTLRQIDEAHEKASGQARKQFNGHKDRFVEGVDFFDLTSSEIKTMSELRVFPERTARGMLFTERGYGKIARGWNDDLSWALHDAMQDAYFLVKEAQASVEFDDSTDAILGLMADIRSEIISAQQSGAATSLEHIDGSKAAVLHYLKAYLKEPAQAFYADAQERNKAAYRRDQIMKKQMDVLVDAVRDLLIKARPALLDRPFILEEWFDAQRIYAEFFADRVIPYQRFLSQSIGKALDGECKRRRRFNDMEQQVIGGKPKNFWHRNIVELWLGEGGRAMVERHIERFLPQNQNVLPFVKKGHQ